MAEINGTSGNDNLVGTADDDVFTGFEGDDTITDSLGGNDRAVFNVSTDGADETDLGDGSDIVEVLSDDPGQVRLTFTSAEVGNGSVNDSGSMMNQDGGLAVRLQAEDGSDGLTGPVSRFDDEGITFVAGEGVTFDVRDLVSGVERGDAFEVVTLGTMGDDTMTAVQPARPYYFNGGMGNDLIIGGDADDFLVGGAGNDILNGSAGEDNFLSGGGNDTIDSVDRPSNIFAGSIAPERDVVDAGDGDDSVTGGKLDQLNGGAGNDFLAVNFNFNGPVVGSAPPITLTLDAGGTGTASDGTSITGFETVNFNLTDGDDAVNTGDVAAALAGNGGNDTLTTGAANDSVFGGEGDDEISTGGGDDTIGGGAGDDTVMGGEGDDTFLVNMMTDGADEVDLGEGDDTVRFDRFDGGMGNVRLTFTSAEVGNGNANDSNTMMNQDGGLAVRAQQEDADGNLIGPVSRYDDEGITFVAGTQGITFDVRDLVSGTQRGATFEGVVLGTSGADTLTFFPPFRAGQDFYFNAGMGDDVVNAGEANDFLVGGGGNDELNGNGGNDSFIGGGGDDTVDGGDGDDTATFNVSTDGSDTTDLGDGSDVAVVNSATAGQVRLTFTSAEVGNGDPNDSGMMANQDGGLAVRLQAEDGADGLTGPVSRFDDEGVTFVAGAGVTFDVRDLVSGTERGDAFEVVTLGTMGDDTLTAIQPDRPYYFNGGMGDDDITGGTADDFLVGGAGDDTLEGGEGDDLYIGGGGRDRFQYSMAAETGDDTIIDFQKVDLFVSDARLRDSNDDGRIMFGANNVLDLDGRGGDTVAFTGLDPASGLRFLGQLDDGGFAYADAATRPMDAIEGMLGNSTLNGGAGSQVFFFDTALGLDFGDDRITGFDSDDLLVTTTAISDSDGDGRIAFGSDRTLDLSDGTSVVINNQSVRALEVDGTVMANGVTYYVYSSVGSTQTGTDDLFG